MDLGPVAGPGTNPLWGPRDDCTVCPLSFHWVLTAAPSCKAGSVPMCSSPVSLRGRTGSQTLVRPQPTRPQLRCCLAARANSSKLRFSHLQVGVIRPSPRGRQDPERHAPITGPRTPARGGAAGPAGGAVTPPRSATQRSAALLASVMRF